MEILDEVIQNLKELEEDNKNIFKIRRLVEREKVRQLKEGTRIKVNPLFYRCPYCPVADDNPETFFLHLVQKHLTPAEEARNEIAKQEKTYNEGLSSLEDLLSTHTEVMLDVDYTDKTRDT